MDYLYQTNQLIGAFHFKRSLQQLPVIDEYEREGKVVYAVWVPEEKGTTMPCSIFFADADSAIVYHTVAGSDTLQSQTVALVHGVIQLTATETPLFVATKTNLANRLAASSRSVTSSVAVVTKDPERRTTTDGLKASIMPNPSNSHFTLTILSNSDQPVSIKITDATGQLVDSRLNTKPNTVVQIGSKLIPGIYFVELIQEGKKERLTMVKE